MTLRSRLGIRLSVLLLLAVAITCVDGLPAAAQNNPANPFANLFGGIIRGAQQQAARDSWIKVDPDVRTCVQQTMSNNNHRPITIDGLVANGIGPENPNVSLDVQSCTQRVTAYRQQAQAAEQARQQAAIDLADQRQRQREEAERRKAEEQRKREEADKQAAIDMTKRIQVALEILDLYAGPTGGDMDTKTRDAIKDYQKSIHNAATGTLTVPQQNSLFAAAAEKTTQKERSVAIAREQESWQSFVAAHPSLTNIISGNGNDLVVLLNTNTPEYRSGQVALTLSGKIDSSAKVTVIAFAKAAETFHDEDGRQVSLKALEAHGINPDRSILSFPLPTQQFVGAADVIVLSRDAFSNYPFLGVPGARAELIKMLDSEHLALIFSILDSDISVARAQRIAAVADAAKKLEQERSQAERQVAERTRRSEEIGTAIASGKITDYALITLDGRPLSGICATAPKDLGVIDIFDGVPSAITRLPRLPQGDDDHVFLALRRGECSAAVGKSADLKAILAGLYRDQLAFSIFPQTIALSEAEEKLAAFEKAEEGRRKRDAAESAERAAAQRDAEEVRKQVMAKQDSLAPKCDDNLTRDALRSAIEHNAISNIATLRLLDLNTIRQISFDPIKLERWCAATFVLNSGQQMREYRLWPNSDKTGFLVEIRAPSMQ